VTIKSYINRLKTKNQENSPFRLGSCGQTLDVVDKHSLSRKISPVLAGAKKIFFNLVAKVRLFMASGA
jgi:hypothetical protein